MLSYLAQKLILAFEAPYGKEEFIPETSKIKISEIASRAVFWYEKLRNTLEYNEEHLLLKNAILRILRRRTFWESEEKQIASVLIAELIRAHYLPNNTLPESKNAEIQRILNKYFYLKDKLLARGNDRMRQDFDWLLQIAASEIEENLVPQDKERVLAEVMYEVIKKNLTFKDINLNTNVLNIQLFAAIQRSLLKADSAIIRYRLIKYFYPEWKEIPMKDLDEIAINFAQFKQKIEEQVKHPWSFRLSNICQKYTVYFLILRDVVEKYPEGAAEDLEKRALLAEKVQEACQARYKQARLKLRRAGARSIIYIFLTKMLLALALEIPLDYWMAPELNYLSIATNVLFPPLLMFIIVVMIKVPSKKNTQKIIKGIEEIVYEDKAEVLPLRTRLVVRQGFLAGLMFKALYLFMYILTFGLIIRLLLFLQFNVFSIIIFLLFLCLVSFFGYRIRQTPRELLVYKKENFSRFIFDFLSLPVVRMGRWISLKSSKINVFVYFLDFIFEAPFKSLIISIEKISNFISEKRDEG